MYYNVSSVYLISPVAHALAHVGSQAVPEYRWFLGSRCERPPRPRFRAISVPTTPQFSFRKNTKARGGFRTVRLSPRRGCDTSGWT